MQHIIKIKSIKHLTHDVLKIVTEKPKEFDFTPGQAAEISIDKKNWWTKCWVVIRRIKKENF